MIVRACPQHRLQLREVPVFGARGEEREPILRCPAGDGHEVPLRAFVVLDLATHETRRVDHGDALTWDSRHSFKARLGVPSGWPAPLWREPRYARVRPRRSAAL